MVSNYLKRIFEEIIDRNPNLLCFNNGVLDLNTFSFRDGIPEDYITMTTNIDFHQFDPYIHDLENFLQEILPIKAVREYLLYYLSTCLHGENEHQKFMVFTGEGGNGKSLLIKLIEESFGEYACPLDVAIVTQKRQKASTANPGILELKNKRIGIITEPDENDTLNMGIVKALTGNDKIKARALYDNDVTFRNRSKLIMLCNALPTPSSQDQGVWRRIRVVHFPFNFVENPTEENEKKKDVTLETRILEWKNALIVLLLKYYKKLRTELKGELPEPLEVIEFTEQYREKTNLNLEFIRENIVKCDDAEPMDIMTIYQKFKSWYTNSYPGNKCPPKKELQTYIKKTYKKKFTVKGGLVGYRFIEEGEEQVEMIDKDDAKSDTTVELKGELIKDISTSARDKKPKKVIDV